MFGIGLFELLILLGLIFVGPLVVAGLIYLFKSANSSDRKPK